MTEKIITIEKHVYVAEDGTEFYDEVQCKQYEKRLQQKQEEEKALKKAKELEITELDEVMPLDDNGYPNDNWYFKWYKLNSVEDFQIIEKAYNESFSKPEEYPVIMCVESEALYEGGSAYNYLLPDIMRDTKLFFDKFGYDVKFKKVKEN